MQRSTVTTLLESIHPGIRVVRHSNQGEHVFHGGMDAVYFYQQFIGAIPPGNMYLNTITDYRSSGRRGQNYVHRSLQGILNRLRQGGVLVPHKVMGTRHAISNR